MGVDNVVNEAMGVKNLSNHARRFQPGNVRIQSFKLRYGRRQGFQQGDGRRRFQRGNGRRQRFERGNGRRRFQRGNVRRRLEVSPYERPRKWWVV